MSTSRFPEHEESAVPQPRGNKASLSIDDFVDNFEESMYRCGLQAQKAFR